MYPFEIVSPTLLESFSASLKEMIYVNGRLCANICWAVFSIPPITLKFKLKMTEMCEHVRALGPSIG